MPAAERARFRHNLVVHASDLPRGRGWSPMTWRILEGADRLTVTLFEAIDELDAGDIYAQAELVFEGHELIDELHDRHERALPLAKTLLERVERSDIDGPEMKRRVEELRRRIFSSSEITKAVAAA